MTSFVYTEMEKLNPRTVLHERETSSSGRPKAQSLYQEDQFFSYIYTSTGGLRSKSPKSPAQQYDYWYKHNVKLKKTTKGIVRETPLTEFEKQLGIRPFLTTYCYKTRCFNEKEWQEFLSKFPKNSYGQADIDYGDLETHVQPDNKKSWIERAEEMDLILVNGSQLEFKKKHPYCIANNIHGTNCDIVNTPELPLPVVEKIPTPARPNPKEVKKVEPVEVEPIKEAVKYSPLMIAGILVVIVLFLKRRA